MRPFSTVKAYDHRKIFGPNAITSRLDASILGCAASGKTQLTSRPVTGQRSLLRTERGPELKWTGLTRRDGRVGRGNQPHSKRKLSQLGFDLFLSWLLMLRTKQDTNKSQVFLKTGAESASHSAQVHRDEYINLTATATLHNLKGLGIAARRLGILKQEWYLYTVPKYVQNLRNTRFS